MPTLIVDGGNLGQDTAKRSVIVQAMAKMGYAVCFASGNEVQALSKAFRVEPGGTEVVLPLDPAQPASAFWISESEGARIALARFDAGAKAADPHWQETVARLAAQAASQADLVVLVSALSPGDTRSLARSIGPRRSVQAIIVASGVHIRDLPEREAGIRLCPTKDCGQAVTVIDAVRGDERRWAVTCRLESVANAYPQERAIQALVNAHYERRQAALESTELPLSEAAYVLATRCKSCHVEAYRVWRESAHANAVATLGKHQRLVPECLTCHSEQFRRTGRFDADTEPGSDGVQCSTCHGDGVVHSLTRGTGKLRRELACDQCHNNDHAPGFLLDEALTAIGHWG